MDQSHGSFVLVYLPVDLSPLYTPHLPFLGYTKVNETQTSNRVSKDLIGTDALSKGMWLQLKVSLGARTRD